MRARSSLNLTSTKGGDVVLDFCGTQAHRRHHEVEGAPLRLHICFLDFRNKGDKCWSEENLQKLRESLYNLPDEARVLGLRNPDFSEAFSMAVEVVVSARAQLPLTEEFKTEWRDKMTVALKLIDEQLTEAISGRPTFKIM